MDDSNLPTPERDSDPVKTKALVDSTLRVGHNLGEVIGVLIKKVGNIKVENINISVPKGLIIGVVIILCFDSVISLPEENLISRYYKGWMYSSPENDCNDPMNGDLNIAIADFTAEENNIGQLLLDRLKTTMHESTGLDADYTQFRRLPLITSDAEAQQLGECNHATIVIWSRREPTTKASFPEIRIIEPQEGSDKAIPLDDLLSASSSAQEAVVQLKHNTQIVALFIAGLNELLTDHYTQAANRFEQAIGLTNDYVKDPVAQDKILANLYFYQGRSLSGAHDEAAAMQAYEACLAANHNYAWAHIGIGNIYLGRGQQPPVNSSLLDQARIQFENALNIYEHGQRNLPPREVHIPAKAHLGIGNVYTIRAQDAQATDKPQDVVRFTQLARQHLDAALDIYIQAQEQDPVPDRYIARIHYGLGILHDMIKNMWDAKQELDVCVEQTAHPLAKGLRELCIGRLNAVSPLATP